MTLTPVPSGPLIELKGIYPNPFEDELKLYFRLRADASVSFKAYNVAGELIFTEVKDQPQGMNFYVWPGENDSGGRVASGVYILRVEAEGVTGQRGDFWAQAAVVR